MKLTIGFCRKRIEEQNEYIYELDKKSINGNIDSARYDMLRDSAFAIRVYFRNELLKILNIKDSYYYLQECLFALNSIPNQVYGEKDTYTLASEIDKYLKDDK